MYLQHELPLPPLNVRSTQFRRFDQNRVAWVRASTAIDLDRSAYKVSQ